MLQSDQDAWVVLPEALKHDSLHPWEPANVAPNVFQNCIKYAGH